MQRLGDEASVEALRQQLDALQAAIRLAEQTAKDAAHRKVEARSASADKERPSSGNANVASSPPRRSEVGNAGPSPAPQSGLSQVPVGPSEPSKLANFMFMLCLHALGTVGFVGLYAYAVPDPDNHTFGLFGPLYLFGALPMAMTTESLEGLKGESVLITVGFAGTIAIWVYFGPRTPPTETGAALWALKFSAIAYALNGFLSLAGRLLFASDTPQAPAVPQKKSARRSIWKVIGDMSLLELLLVPVLLFVVLSLLAFVLFGNSMVIMLVVDGLGGRFPFYPPDHFAAYFAAGASLLAALVAWMVVDYARTR
jgi:hypothetical protein